MGRLNAAVCTLWFVLFVLLFVFFSWLGAFALVVREVERRRLHTAVRIARPEDRVHHADGRHRARATERSPGRDGQLIFQALQLAGEARQTRGLDVVAQGDERLEGGLGAAPAVLVHLVGPQRRFDAGVLLFFGVVVWVVVVGLFCGCLRFLV